MNIHDILALIWLALLFGFISLIIYCTIGAYRNSDSKASPSSFTAIPGMETDLDDDEDRWEDDSDDPDDIYEDEEDDEPDDRDFEEDEEDDEPDDRDFKEEDEESDRDFIDGNDPGDDDGIIDPADPEKPDPGYLSVQRRYELWKRACGKS